MISFEKARKLIIEHSTPTQVIEKDLLDSLGCVVAEDVKSLCDSPRFDNSAVDGYAFRFEEGQKTYKVVGEVSAGDHFRGKLIRGECVRIFTGAMMPDGADTCVMQEYVSRVENTITHTDGDLSQGTNVRYKAEELAKGTCLLETGSVLHERAIGLLTSCGVNRVKVHAKPRVCVIVTGSEFIQGREEEGKINNSNGPMLAAALASFGFDTNVIQVNDDRALIKKEIANALDDTDVVITTGGVSVGDHDHVVPVCDELGLEKVFHKVAQKPGKPMYFGTGQGKHLVGLPGNPRAVMIGFYLHVLPLFAAMQKAHKAPLDSCRLPVAEDIKLKGARTELLAVLIEGGSVLVNRKQNSHMLSSLLDAHGIMIVPQERREVFIGEELEVILLK